MTENTENQTRRYSETTLLAIHCLEWMIADMKHRYDSEKVGFGICSINPEVGPADPAFMQGAYSPELTAAMELLKMLQDGDLVVFAQGGFAGSEPDDVILDCPEMVPIRGGCGEAQL